MSTLVNLSTNELLVHGRPYESEASDFRERGTGWCLNRLFSFKMAQVNPWLRGYELEQEECKQLHANCRHQAYGRTINYLDTLLASSTLKLVPSNTISVGKVNGSGGGGSGGDDDDDDESESEEKDYCTRTRAGRSKLERQLSNMLVVGLKDSRTDDSSCVDERGEHRGAINNRWRLSLSEICLLIISITIAYSTIFHILCARMIYEHDIMLSNRRPTIRRHFNATQTAPTSVTSGRHQFKPDDQVTASSDGDETAAPAAESTTTAGLQPGAAISADGVCVLRQQVETDKLFDEQQFVEINKRLASLGVPIRTQVGSNFLSNAIIASSALVFYCLPIGFVLLARGALRLDTLAFIYDPVGERRRLASGVRVILCELVAMFEFALMQNASLRRPSIIRQRQQDQSSADDGNADSCRHRHSIGRVASDNRRWGPRTDDRQSCSSSGSPLCPGHVGCNLQCEKLKKRWLTLRSSCEFLTILNDIHERQLVRSIRVNSEWHFIKLKTTNLMVSAFLFISIGFPLTSNLVAVIVEGLFRALERLKSIECTRWHPSGAILKTSLHLDPLDEADRRLYELYDGTWWYLGYLVLKIESKHLFTLNTGLFTFRSFVLSTSMGFWSTLWTSVYLIGFVDIIASLTQVKCQLEWCTSLCMAMRSYNHEQSHQRAAASGGGAAALETNLTSTSTAIRDHCNGSSLNERQRSLLLRHITLTFVNYELFRREYGPFRLLTNFLLFLAATFTGLSLAELYLIATKVENKFRFFSLFSSVCILCFMNIYLVVASYTSKLVERIMLQLTKLMAQVAHHPDLIILPPLDLWRRQMLDEAEIHLFLSTRVFNYSVSYKRLLAFNVQLFGVWLLLWRVIGHSGGGESDKRNQ